MPRGGKINRREFLRASALAAAGITLAACGANQATPTTAPGGGASPSPTGGGASPSPTAGTAGGGSTSGEVVHLRFMTWLDASGKALMDQAIKEFEQQHPNIQITQETVAGTGAATYPDVLKTGMAGGNPPDMFFMWGGSLAAPFIDANQVIRMEQYYKRYGWDKVLIPHAVQAIKRKGALYGVPIHYQGMGFWYRKDIFQKHGLQPPKTYQELEQICQKLKEHNIAALSMGGKYGWNVMRLLDYFIEMEAGPEKHDKLDRLEASWDDTAVVNAYKLLNKWASNGWIPEGFMAVTPDDARIPWFQGKAAMVFEGGWIIPVIKQQGQDITKYGYIVPPTGHKPERISAFPEQIMIAKASKHPDEAAEFINWFIQPSIQEKYYDISGSTATANVKLDPKKYPLVNEWNQVVATHEAYPPTDQAFYKELMDSYFRVQDAIIDGRMTPEQGAKEMQKAAEEWKARNPGKCGMC